MAEDITAGVEQRNDVIVEDDLRRGWRVSEVPADLQAALASTGVATFTHVRLTRLNPTRRRKITEVVQRAFFKDLQDQELLSNEQVKVLVEGRGAWTPKHESRMRELYDRTQPHMATLYHEGVRRSNEWLEGLDEHRTKLFTLIDASERTDDEKAEFKRRFTRWFDYTPVRQEAYQAEYPDALGTDGKYYPDRDLSWLMDSAPTLEGVDVLQDLDDLNGKVQNFVNLVTERDEYETLHRTRLRIFANTVESRRDNAEEMARVYFCSERSDAEGNPLGSLVAKFEDLYEFPDTMITWLVEEAFFFHNGIPPETREFLKKFSFTGAGVAQEPETTEPTKLESPPPQEVTSTPITGSEPVLAPSVESPAVPAVSTPGPSVIKTA